MCLGTKIKHPTREAALDHIKSLVWKNQVHGRSDRSAGLAPYPCEACNAWHVGHAATTPLVWHYTVKRYLDAILSSDCLRPAPSRRVAKQDLRSVSQSVRVRLLQLNEPAPLLWFSHNREWEYSVIKTDPPWSRARTEISGRGLLRFGVSASCAKLRWYDYLRLNRTSRAMRAALSATGNPAEWLATNDPVPLDQVRAIEVYCDDAWRSVTEVEDVHFDAYLAARPDAYKRALAALHDRLGAAQLATVSPETIHQIPCANETERVALIDLLQLVKTSPKRRKL